MSSKQEDIEQLARRWYSALDTHEPLATLVAMLNADDLTMVFPEVTTHGLDGFADWYERVIRIFFDEKHSVQEVRLIEETPDTAIVAVTVRWEASRWVPPAPHSERIIMLAYQTWTLGWRGEGAPKISKYTVDRLEYLPGSVTL